MLDIAYASWLLTSAPTLSRMTADTAGVDSNEFWPTQIRLTPFAAAILVMIYIAYN